MDNRKGNCCVLGGAGFIGSVLVAHLCRSGRTVKVVGRSSAPAYMPAGATYVRADLCDPVNLRGLFDGVCEVIDLVYGVPPKVSFGGSIGQTLTNIQTTVAIMEELARSKVDRYIYVSSGGTVYGEAISLPITEEHPTHPISPYGMSKLACEGYVDLYHACRDIPSIIARLGNAYGEHQAGNTGQGFIATVIWCFLHNQPVTIFGNNGAIRDYIHVEDIATALLALLDKGSVGETYNIGTGISTDNLQIFDCVVDLAKGTDIVIPKIKFSPSRCFDVQENVLDVHKLKAQTGWMPHISLHEGVRRCWDYMWNGL